MASSFHTGCVWPGRGRGVKHAFPFVAVYMDVALHPTYQPIRNLPNSPSTAVALDHLHNDFWAYLSQYGFITN